MMKYKVYVKLGAILSIALLVSFIAPGRKIRVYLIGDSTISIKEKKGYPENGWGMPFVNFFDEGVIVDNRAQNGRSTKSFINEKRWQSVADSLQKGDYVLIQFGHNDEVETKKAYTTPEAFKANLLRFVTETRRKKAHPVLITPVSRRSFDATGKALETHPVYSGLLREVAAAQKVPLIDLDRKSIELYQKLGEEGSKLLFNHLQPGDHPNYPEGKVDNTHFNELGAREIAQLVLKEIKVLKLDLAKHIVKPFVKK
ncbi:rhamnogalacturonan acetylesterase [Pedobacter sp. AW31-3R]|uniref:rhamnogalacturonan acetylesterase n=1 Tax=Pedobacter sp. AW31-3R TaxID=3445781 RepID=UPI003FA171F8